MGRKQLVLGVDGGGTKSIGLIADEDGNILARREVGATNPNVVGFDTSAKHIVDLILSVCEDVRCNPDEVRSIVLGLAGAGAESDRNRLLDEVHTLFAGLVEKKLPITIETDARVALEGAFNGGHGVVVIAGTGSIVIGKTQRGEVVTVGGWGRIVGDEGSGYYIGREALAAIALHMDKRGEATRVKDVVARTFGWETREQLIAAVYHENFDIASLAPVIFEAAAAYDVVSQRILQKAATLLADQASVIVKQMGILRKVGMVMCGSLIDHETVYANVLHMKILKVLPQVDIRPAVHSPAHGAVLLALALLKRN